MQSVGIETARVKTTDDRITEQSKFEKKKRSRGAYVRQTMEERCISEISKGVKTLT
jgi:hypothetical protein